MEKKIDEKYIRQLVSKNLKRLRTLHGLSQLGLSVNAGIAHNFINDVENGRKGVSIKTLAKLSAALNVEPHQFFLPDNMTNNTAHLYVHDFNDMLQKMVKDLTAYYIPSESKNGKGPA